MPALTREQILAAADLASEIVEVPEWGGSVRVAEMSGATRDAWEYQAFSAKTDQERLSNVRARLAALCVVDDAGAPLFTREDVIELGRKSGAALDRIYDVAVRLNKLGKRDVDELEGNSKADLSGSSTSV